MNKEQASEQKRKIVPPAWLLATIILMVLMHYRVHLGHYVQSPFHYGGVLFVIFGLVMAIMSAGAFKKADTGIVPFDEATTLVTDGYYCFTRNPMYLGMVMFLLGTSIYLTSIASLLPIPFFIWVIHANFILGEERFMEQAFGAEYLEYKKKVRRWL